MSPIRKSAKPRSLARLILGGLGTAALVGGSLFLGLAPTSYLVEKPGPVYDVLSTIGGKPVIAVNDLETYPTQGSLDLLTVSVSGDAKRGASWLQLGWSFFEDGAEIIPLEDVYPPGVDSNQVNEEADIMMLDSQASAKAAALTELGYQIETNVRVSVVQKNGAAGGILKAGDILLTVDGEKATGIDQVRAQVAASQGKRPVVLEVLRGDETFTFEITPRLVDSNWRLGIFVATVPEVPVDISIEVGNVGGPSGGQIFALAIYDLLTPGSLVDGNHVAGTGTIDVDGKIGAIGGIKQKLHGAKNAGAKYFLAPSANCSEVVGNIPQGLQVIKVSTLKDSINALEAIKSEQANTLPSCK
ncbi:MAG: PDZ domain-containing protein [Micrococcales bacterium]|nr:PDZ domain-containing protein [Micrococcales bacterium]